MDRNLQAELDECMEEVTVFLLRQHDRYEATKDSIKPDWYSGSDPLPMPK